MEHIEHETMIGEALTDSVNADEEQILDPNASEHKLELLYGQMANILLQLSTLTFSRIGSLVEHEDGHTTISVEDEDDARDKYVARQLFRQLASDGRLMSEAEPEENSKSLSRYLIYSSDFRPSNVLVDKDLRVLSGTAQSSHIKRKGNHGRKCQDEDGGG
ncbi:hypothetical protein F5B22DRAFT_641903 [Xylaria bambusicola]|uniref:uncharacterized protein n=1 Tax=Xylaria bambusicola TaxID=326684 RepID=UPI0020079F66|nr:uncharacterized protein F5B22DRAFT_641903 [Xylaria bambusicola]KAI0525752.1 hypothetical protein F5B22DRAFT_641903 [Xylaria bambusicola]